MYMILELVEGGELFDRIVRLGSLHEADAKFLFLQIAYAVQPENILLSGPDNRCLIKVTDFGLSKLVDGNTMLRTFCGTPTYLAPEVLKTAGSGTYTSAIDIWSLGVILYVCLVGYPPFTDERQDHDLQTQIVQGLYDFPEAYWEEISKDAKDLVCGMLTVEPSDRLTIQEHSSVRAYLWVRVRNLHVVSSAKGHRAWMKSTADKRPTLIESLLALHCFAHIRQRDLSGDVVTGQETIGIFSWKEVLSFSDLNHVV
ncbi:unnamed protein product [Echinostoma caproni]|uniref:Protein kinase domain-containing protein n=1 Tax=Echinostoma caproni TaxID=27848 RepID=A0A3P8GLN3_9TREM|nr:unnamed protein product [Echinostoma caproni]